MLAHTILAVLAGACSLSAPVEAGRSLSDHLRREVPHSARPPPAAPLLHTIAQRIRRLQNAPEGSVATVTTPQEFEEAVLAGSEHIVVEEHLDFSQYESTTQLNWTAAFHIPEGVKSIHGNCLALMPSDTELDLEATAAPLLPQKDGQCLLAFAGALMAMQSTSGGMLLLDNLYFRDVRVSTENDIIVVLASGRKYDSSPVDTGKGLFLSHVTVQGTGANALRGLYTTGRVYAEECVFSHLGYMQGLPPVKARFQGSNAAFKACTFQDNYSPNEFGPILVEDNAAVKLEDCSFKNNTPDLLDAFSGGQFFSDVKRTVWNNPTATFLTAGSLEDAEVSSFVFLNSSDPFLVDQEEESMSILPAASGGTSKSKLELPAHDDPTNPEAAASGPPSSAAAPEGFPDLDDEHAYEEDEDSHGDDDTDTADAESVDVPQRGRRARVQLLAAGGRKLV